MSRMESNSSSSFAFRDARRASRVGELIARHKIDAARALTPEQRLLLALQLSDAAVLLHRSCLQKL
jgi:hypothetical protein